MVQYYWHPGGYPQQQQMTPPSVPLPAARRQEESYIENILRMNKGKLGTFYFTFEHSKEHNSIVITGYVEAAGRDHVILSDPNGKRYLMLMIYFDYATFDEEINYSL
ncbi:spore coat protein GerQ [Psychrobacillus sp. L3]|uniref:spore coat protein GerQ n=1 Tax=Psychrobacillus sp. L3 TaxID=3236891 RepID=UPI0036F27BAF